MAIIPEGMQFIGISPDIVLQEKKSAQLNGKSEPYRMTDIIETVSAEIPTGADWGDITGTLSNQTDLQSALDAKQDDLVSGTNIKTVNGSTILGSGNLQITTTDQWGDITGTLSNQTDLQSALDDKASVNSTSGVLPYNLNGAFQDSPFSSIISNPSNKSATIGDSSLGSFEWSTGGIAPFNASYIKFDTFGYDLFECTFNYFKLDAKTGNPSRVDGLLFNTYAGGLGFGRGLDINSGSTEESIYWNLNTGDFTINGVYGMECFYSSPNEGKTYLSQSSYDFGIWSGAMYISDNLTNTDSVAGSHGKVLNVRDSNGNSYAIKLYPYN